MALVTVSRSPPGSGASTPVGPWDQAVQRRSRLQRRGMRSHDSCPLPCQAELCGAPWGCPGTAGWRGQ
ncbi:SSH3 isoform 12 [Pan troglodytes]|uniref:SSH3 isoform 12 n=1 Tax=Pan troglodytes TaxID=9598 RepID=A0A2J8QB46_PANTR|nr:SSH3 isoform 12 [Pan troglodytes]